MRTPLSAAVISAFITLIAVASTVHSLGGSASTLAVSYGATTTVCGIVAEQQTQRIQCWLNNYTIIVFPEISFESVAGGRDFFCGVRNGGFSLLCWNSSFTPKRLYYSGNVVLQNLTIGDTQICALTNGTRNAKCWRGDAISAQLPDGSAQFHEISSGLGFSCGILMNTSRVSCWGGWANSSYALGIELSLPKILPGPCVQAKCDCGLYPQSQTLCSGRGNICRRCDVINSIPPISPPTTGSPSPSSPSKEMTRGLLAFAIVGSVGALFAICTIIYFVWTGACFGHKKIHNSVQPTITRSNSNAQHSNNSPPSRSSTIRQQGSRAWGRQRSGTSGVFSRQRSGTSAKHAERAEEFTFSDLEAATNSFSLENKIGAGSFGVVYKGKLPDGHEVAIKRGETGTKTKKFQEKESAFDSELAFLSRLHHKHLVRLVGYCEERDERLLVYDYMKNGALYDHLHDKNNVAKNSSLLNSWKMRIKISLDAARGIEYLHNYAVPPIIHRDIKSSNILLDANWTARVSDFGLSLHGPESDRDYRPMKAAGTVGYIDPEYYGLNVLTAKSDVYGLGVVLLELLTGKRAIFKSGENGGTPISLVDFAVPAIMTGELMKILDTRVGPPELNEAEAVELVAYTALHCVNLEGKERPTMTDIVANLERALALCDDSHGSISSGPISIVSE